MNSVQLLGRVGKDPEMRFAQSGTAVAKLSLATSKKIKDEDQTQWHRLVAFGKTAEIIEKYVKKGNQLCIEGEISYGDYEKDGHKVYTTDIIVNRFHFVGDKKKEQPRPEPEPRQEEDQDSFPF